MPKRRKSQFLRALEQRRDEAARERTRREREEAAEEAQATEPRPTERRVLVERAPALFPSKPRRKHWK